MIYSLEALQNLVNTEIGKKKFSESPAELYDPIRYLLNLGGKRLRPCLLLLAKNLFSETVEDALDQAIGLEVFHNFTLIHDDIMDKAPLRRGFPTVHEKWNVNIGILSGDVMFVEAYELITSAEPRYLKKLISVFNKVAREVCEGQQIDMNFEQESTVSIDDYLYMIERKTAVLIGGSLQMGAILGDANQETALELYHFGRCMGIAFQLQDDLLDVYGSPEKFGKRVGGDILSNKKTFLLLKAMEASSESQLLELKRWLVYTGTNEEQKVSSVKAVYDSIGIQQMTDELIEKFTNEAFQHLSTVQVKSERKEVLAQFCQALSKREF